MCQYMPDVNLRSVKMDGCNQPVLVAADVEYSELANLVSTRIHATHVREFFPFCMFRRSVPGPQRLFCVWMLSPEFAQFFLRDDMHCPSLPFLPVCWLTNYIDISSNYLCKLQRSQARNLQFAKIASLGCVPARSRRALLVRPGRLPQRQARICGQARKVCG